MKSIRNILIAVFLGLILAVLNWTVARAPKGENVAIVSSVTLSIVQDEEVQINEMVSETPSVPTASAQHRYVVTLPVEELEEPLETPSTAAPENIAYSCTDGEIGSGSFTWPAENHSLSGKDYASGHPGIDIAAGEGSPVYAADGGIVVAKGNDVDGYGQVIQIDHGNGYLTVYAHLSVIDVSMCQSVKAGQRIGRAGSTGNARGAHLHFEVALDGWYINPWDVLP